MNASRSTHFPAIRSRLGIQHRTRPAFRFNLTHDTWPKLWRDVSISLYRTGYQISTLTFYRQIIRSFSRFVNKPPHQVTPIDIKNYLWSLVGKPYTWHWMSMNISVLRTVFDKLADLKSLDNQRGPRWKISIPEHLSREQIAGLLSAATTLRDQLVLAFLYGCGLKIGELQRIRWRDIQPENGVMLLSSRYKPEIRRLALPVALIPILKEGKSRCPPDEYIFPGASRITPITSRAIQVIVRNCAIKADSRQSELKFHCPVNPQILRNSYAVHALESGANIREVQEAMDHQRIETTLRYEACINRSKIRQEQHEETSIPVSTPGQLVKVEDTGTLNLQLPFPIHDPEAHFLSNLKTRFTDRFVASRRYFNSG